MTVLSSSGTFSRRMRSARSIVYFKKTSVQPAIRRKRIPTAETNLRLGKKQICDYRNDLFVFLGKTGAPEADIPHSGHVCAAEFIREPSHAIGQPASIIYLGNYTEAGSTPVVREPQIIERQAFVVSPTTPPAEPPGIVKRFLQN